MFGQPIPSRSYCVDMNFPCLDVERFEVQEETAVTGAMIGDTKLSPHTHTRDARRAGDDNNRSNIDDMSDSGRKQMLNRKNKN